MKIIKYHRQRIFFTFFIITTLFISLSISVMAQDLNVSQTLDYLNKKFQDFPFQTDNSIFHYSFSITSNGELRIENADYFKNPFEPGETSLAAKTIFKIGINKIDIKESLESYHYGETDYILYLYPSLNEYFYEERIDRNGVQEYKKTVPYQSKSESIGGVFRNYISIYLGDVGNKQNIRNALMHLYTIVISDPIKYGLNTQIDPFDNISRTNIVDAISLNSSSTIRMLKNTSGLLEIPVVLNDVLKINFIIDSGASEVSLSPDVALTLIRTGTITDNDWLPSQTYRFADGSTAQSNRFVIRKLAIGNRILTDIEASISKSIEAPMLMGQNVIQKLGTITIDSENLLLIINNK